MSKSILQDSDSTMRDSSSFSYAFLCTVQSICRLKKKKPNQKMNARQSKSLEFKVAGLQALQDLVGVVLLGNGPQPVEVVLAVAGKDVLLLRGVVLVQVGVVEPAGLGGGDGAVDNVLRGGEDALVIGNVGPAKVNVDDYFRCWSIGVIYVLGAQETI